VQLTGGQLAEMRERGFVLLPSLFSPDEVQVIRGAIPRVLASRGPEVIGEDDDPSVIKMVFGAHVQDDVFRRVSFHPRLVEPAEQILGESAHLFQTRLNVKPAFRATGWPWHQDFNQWYRQDGMQTPRAVVAGLFVDDVNACNGPLMVIPGSHRRGHLVNEVSMELDEADVESAARESGIVPLMGPPGTVALFDCLIIHGSAANITPWPRRIFYLNFSALSNHEFRPLREWFHCDPDVRPIPRLADDCLLEWRATV
jgi:ectoine hydroxylase